MAKDWAREARSLVEDVLDKHAAEVDRTGRIPGENFDELARRGFYGFLLEEGITPHAVIDTASTLIAGCLSTGFVWAQHTGTLRRLAASTNTALRDRYLNAMTAGEFRCGVTYAGTYSPPTLFAERDGDDFVLSGRAPFVTGWGHIHGLGASVRVRGEQEALAALLIPLDEVDGLHARRLPLIAADASATVELTVEGTRVPADYLIDIKPTTGPDPNRLLLADWTNGVLALGILARNLAEMRALGDDGRAAAHESRYAQLRDRFVPALGNAERTYSLRADISHAALEAAAAVMVATGSKSLDPHSTAARLYRQAAFGLVCTTTHPIKQQLLAELEPGSQPMVRTEP